MKLFIVRHGETDLNVQGLVQGHCDSPLSPAGQIQVAALASRLKEEPVTQIFSSDLGRALSTAGEIAKYHSVTVHPTELIRERNFGKLEQGAWKMIGILTEQLRVQPHEFIPPDGESIDVMRSRARQFIDRYLPLESDETVVVVAHAGINRCLVAELLDLTSKTLCNIRQGNACINYFHMAGQAFESVRLNDTAHLT